MKRILYTTALLAVGVMSSCLKDDRQPLDPDKGVGNVIDFKNPSDPISATTSTYVMYAAAFEIPKDVNATMDYKLTVSWSGAEDTAPQDIVLNLNANDAAVAAYNTEQSKSYTVLPSSLYTIPATVTIPKGTPSAEGPLTTTKDQGFSFQTYGAMRFVAGYCDYMGSKTCRPSDAWYMQFTNPIDATTFDKSQIRIEPPVENLNIYPSGNYI